MKNYISDSTKRMNILTKVLILAFFIIAGLYLTNKFFDTFRLITPIEIKIQSPIQRRGVPKKALPPRVNEIKRSILSPTPVVKVPKTDREIINSYKHADILWKIYGLESSWGRNDACKNEGKFNGYGYGQNTTSWNCFVTFEEVTGKVNAWIENKLATRDLVGALCLYNLGQDNLVNCKYYQKFISL